MTLRVPLPLTIVSALTVAVLSAAGFAQAPPTPDQMVAALKKNLAESQARLRTYEWIETTSISLKGEEKARKQNRAYYGADGKLTKVPMGEPPPAAEGSAGRGGRSGRMKERIVENKKDDMQEYMEKAVALVHQYVPPTPEKVQAAKDAGRMKVQPPQGGKLRIEFPEFVQPSDLLAIDLDVAAARLTAINVATYLEKQEDTVTLDVRFGALTDGTSYTEQTTLNAAAKNIKVVVSNSGHRPLVR